MKIKTLQKTLCIAAVAALALPLSAQASSDKAGSAAHAKDSASAKAAAGSDAALASAVRQSVKSRYHFSPESVGIRVRVVNGVVNLSGQAPSSVRADQAQDAASRVPGVKAIDNQLSWPDNT